MSTLTWQRLHSTDLVAKARTDQRGIWWPTPINLPVWFIAQSANASLSFYKVTFRSATHPSGARQRLRNFATGAVRGSRSIGETVMSAVGRDSTRP